MTNTGLRWDIFCQVIDNFGDIGVCWRLAVQLAGRGQAVRLWVDDSAALEWMAPEGCPGVQVLRWTARQGFPEARAQPGGDPERDPRRDDAFDSSTGYEPGDVVIEAFGAALAPAVVAAIARANAVQRRRIAWINLEYLSAEAYAAGSHGLASPVHGGSPAGVRKWFFFPGFTPDTGGLLREPDLAQRQAQFDRTSWRARHAHGGAGELIISLFCYEPAVLAPWLLSLRTVAGGQPVCLLVTHGRATAAVRRALGELPADWNAGERVRIVYLPALTQREFDHLLWSADVNFVRGEDSLVRALWAGAPFVWQIYPQDDGAHLRKLVAFLGLLTGNAAAVVAVQQYFLWWNGAVAGPPPALDWQAWKPIFGAACQRQRAQSDLLTRLQRFVAENR
jgi:uncharacterized repeat protein (TIGR03837 family)